LRRFSPSFRLTTTVFNLALVPSRPARLWIDLFTYAAIDEASGAYLFVRNSEEGRRTLYSSTNVADMADRITRYCRPRDRAARAASKLRSPRRLASNH
jgi:hypothetical protein